jgi:hypothetical protein
MSERILDINRHSGVIETFQQHEGRNVIRKHQNTDAIFAANNNELNGHVSGNNWQGDMHKVASIPLIVVDMWREELKAKGVPNCDPLHNDNKTFFIAKINSSEWSNLRTKQGRI